ncbi:hypothetical protein [Janibacter sp. GS2]|uniref:hypothetical protein n=1 Tax=Janibacter sp. GS2 TaxID=3442646 RepID=UPI003EC0A35C
MKTTGTMRATSLLAVAALGLSACGGSDEDTTRETSSTSQASPSESATSDEATESEDAVDEEVAVEESESSDGAGAGGSAELTEPGTQLEVGARATIPQGDDDAAVTVTVSKVTRGTSDDLSQLEDADKYADYTPVYVQYTMTGTDSSSELGGDLLDDVDPITADGRKASTLVLIGTSPFEKCDRNSIPDDFGPGDTETTCQVAMVSGDQKITGAQFAPYEGDYADDGKVVWTQ